MTEDIDGDLDNLLEVSGILSISDPDAGESSFLANTIVGSYGTLWINASGNWSYAADNTQVAIQSLDAGETLLDTLTIQTYDGTLHDIVITINGAEDNPVLGGVAIGSVAEDGSLTASETLTISDVDTNDNPVSFNAVTSIPGNNGYGHFTMASNTWSYTLDNNHAAVQALAAGESLTDHYTFTASDGSTQQVNITIQGANDAPTVDVLIPDQTATQDVPYSFTFPANSFSDMDNAAVLTYSASLEDDSMLPSWLTFDNNSLTLSGTPGNSDVGVLNIKLTASDGLATVTDSFQLTVQNVNDAPSATPVTLTPITEDSGSRLITQSELLATASDMDDGTVLTASGLTLITGQGSLSDNGDGTWTFTPAADDAASVYFEYNISDGYAIVANSASLDILPVSDAESDYIVTAQPNTVNLDPLSNDRFSSSASINSVTQAAHGQVVLETDGTVSYTPDASFYGNDQFTYSVTDGQGNIESATVMVTVQQKSITIVEVPSIETEPEQSRIETPSVEVAVEMEEQIESAPIANPEGNPETSADMASIDYESGPESNIEENINQLTNNSSNVISDSDQQENSPHYDSQNGFQKIDIRQPDSKQTQNLAELIQMQAMKDQIENQANLSLMNEIDTELDIKHEQALWDKIDAMNRHVDDDLSREKESEVEVEIALGSTAGLTAGFISWILRGGSLLASMMSTLPMLNRFDPMAIVGTKTTEKKKKKLEKDSVEAKVDEMFANQKRDDD